MGMQTFLMFDANSEPGKALMQCSIQATDGIFTKHQVLRIRNGKRLLILPFDGGLDRGL